MCQRSTPIAGYIASRAPRPPLLASSSTDPLPWALSYGAVRALLASLIVTLLLGGITSATAQVSDRDRLHKAVEYLLGSQLQSGLFLYDFDFLVGRPVEGDNVVRQAVTAYFLGEYYLRFPDPRTRLAIEAALHKYGEISLPIGKSLPQSVLERTGLLSLPVGRYKLRAGLERLGLLYRTAGDGKVLSLDASYGNALTGATALALLSELQYYQGTADGRFAALRSAWLQGLMSVRIPGRGFKISPGFIDDTPFFDGEGWLALASYNQMFPQDTSVAATLESLDSYLMARYANDVKTGFYQWGTMAAARRFKVTSDQKFLMFVRAQAEAFLNGPPRDRWRGENTCAWIEGLATAAAMLRARKDSDGALLARIDARVNEDMEVNRALQIGPNMDRIAFGEGISLTSPKLRDFSGAFLLGRYEPTTRVDMTGHCVSAILKLTANP